MANYGFGAASGTWRCSANTLACMGPAFSYDCDQRGPLGSSKAEAGAPSGMDQPPRWKQAVAFEGDIPADLP